MSDQARSLDRVRVCPECNGTFTVRYASQPRKYCSQRCMWDSYKLSPEEHLSRFWSRVEKRQNGCWIYKGATDKWGYTHVGVNGKRKQAHRWIYEKVKGAIPAGMLLMHSCDVPACVNPDHLTPGTDATNHADSKAKGRNTYGEKNPHAKLTEELVREIRAEYRPTRAASGKIVKSNVDELVAKYGLPRQAISNAALGHTWKHIK